MDRYKITVNKFGARYWALNGEFHRRLHREGGPAVEYHNGEKYWYLNGKRHSLPEYIMAMRSLHGSEQNNE